MNFHGSVAEAYVLGGSVAEPMCWVGGWLDQVGIWLTQLSTGLKFEAELGNKLWIS